MRSSAKQLALPRGQSCAFDRTDTVEEHLQRPLGCDLRIELPQRAGRGIPWIDEEFLAARPRRLVHAVETRERHEHLAARLKETRRVTVENERH